MYDNKTLDSIKQIIRIATNTNKQGQQNETANSIRKNYG